MTAQAPSTDIAKAQPGRIVASNITVAGFPTTGVNVDDYAILTQTDGGNAQGVYRWTSGSAWSFLIGLGTGGGSGTGVTRNTHAHSAAGLLAIPRAAADQDTVVTVTANATGWTHGLTTDRDHLSGRIQGDSGATENYTLALDGAFDSVLQAGATTLDFASIDIYPDTSIEYDLVRNGANFDLVYRVLNVGTPAAAAWTVTWTDGNTQTNTGTGATGNNATYGAGILVDGPADTPNSAYDDASGNQPVIRVIPNGHVDAAAAVANNSYIEFSLTGTNIDAGQVSFDVKKGGTSDPRGWDLRSSADSYAASLGTGNAVGNTSYNTETIDVTALAATTNLTFRLYVFTPSSASVLYVDNFAVEAA